MPFRSKTAIQFIIPRKYLKNQSFQQKKKLQLSYFPNQSKKTISAMITILSIDSAP